MPIRIEDLLHRRTDLSTFVVHLTRDGERPAADNLRSILTSTTISARRARGWAAGEAIAAGGEHDASQRVVCFSETPLEHLYALFADIEDRQHKLAPYGLAFTKRTARRRGINPVWYIDMTPGREWVLHNALNDLRAAALDSGLASSPGGKLFPFIEPMGDWRAAGGKRREFWWEREWRHSGDFSFDLVDVALVIAPEEEHDTLGEDIRGRAVDGSWSLERIIAKLAGVDRDEQTTPMEV